MPQTPSQPLQIAIVGAGQIGSAFALQLARLGGCDVSVVARPGSNRLLQLRRDAAIVDVKGEQAPISVADTLDETVPYDLVIVTLLAHQIEADLPSLRRSAAICIQFMGNMFDPERMQMAVGIERCAFGMRFVQAVLNSEGRLKITIGAGGQKTIMDRQRGLRFSTRLDCLRRLNPTCHFGCVATSPLCIAFQSVSVAGMKRGGGASWGEALILARVVHASFKLIRALGYDLYPRTKRRIAVCPMAAIAAMLWFISRVRSFRELLATGRAECCTLVETMVAAALLAKARSLIRSVAVYEPGRADADGTRAQNVEFA